MGDILLTEWQRTVLQLRLKRYHTDLLVTLPGSAERWLRLMDQAADKAKPLRRQQPLHTGMRTPGGGPA